MAQDSIGACIESLLAQEYPAALVRILVIDNNSTDHSARIIAGYPVQYLKQTAIQSSYAARNVGLQNAAATLVAFTDADCIADRYWLRQGVAAFDEDYVGGVAGAIRAITPQTEVQRYLAARKMLDADHSWRHPFLPYAQTANAFYRRCLFQQIGLFEPRWFSGGDADFSWRMQLGTGYRLVYRPQALVYHRHRSTVAAMFRLFCKNGGSQYLLGKKYRGYLPRGPRLRQECGYLLQHLLPRAFSSYRHHLDYREKLKRRYDLLCFLGYKYGFIQTALTSSRRYC